MTQVTPIKKKSLKPRTLLSSGVLFAGLVMALILVRQSQIFQKKAAVLPETIYYVHTDHLGSTTVVTNSSGNAVSNRVYFPYGTTRTSSGSDLTDKLYTGQVSDTDETGLYYYNARYYSPTIAKFTQADAISDQLNRYAYVGNNPMTRTDPTGNRLEEDSGSLGKPPPIKKPSLPTFSKPSNYQTPDQGLEAENGMLLPKNDAKYNVYLQQIFDNECSVAASTMLAVNYFRRQGIDVDPEEIYKWFADVYNIDPGGGDGGIFFGGIKGVLDQQNIEYSFINRLFSPSQMDTYLKENGPTMVAVNSDYLKAQSPSERNHFVVVVDVVRYNGRTYYEVSDSLTTIGSIHDSEPQGEIIGLPNGNILVPYSTMQSTWGLEFLNIKSVPRGLIKDH